MNDTYLKKIVLNNKKLSSHIAQIIEHIISSNKIIHSYDQMRKMFVSFISKKGENNDNSSPQLTLIHNSIPIIIVNNPGKDLSIVDGKSDTRKLRVS